jgi:hypothetical protein
LRDPRKKGRGRKSKNNKYSDFFGKGWNFVRRSKRFITVISQTVHVALVHISDEAVESDFGAENNEEKRMSTREESSRKQGTWGPW